ncbi:MAG: DegV family protein [Clostridium sp.]|nr:DegV family protein [Clostridium sp.]MCM1399733.1 DegV family protein [Clostridium sp.]MCM1460432.1 DegV family protein [Bacteroides sp.]
MSDYVLVSDSTADLAPEVIKKLGVNIIPFTYSVNDEVFEYYLDERDGDISEFYARLKKGAMPVTSQVNPATYKEYFENIVKEGKDILYLCFSSGLSGSYQTCLMGVDMLKDKYPDANIVVIDSLCASIGEGILLYKAAKKKQEGLGISELEGWIRGTRSNIRHWFMVEDLFHLKRGGRISTVEAMVGSALKIKPILSVDKEGKLFVKSKTRGTTKALEYLVARLVEEGGDLAGQHVVLGHADAPEKVNKLKEMVIEAGVPSENIIIAPIGPIIGTHVGAGMTALAFEQN